MNNFGTAFSNLLRIFLIGIFEGNPWNRKKEKRERFFEKMKKNLGFFRKVWYNSKGV